MPVLRVRLLVEGAGVRRKGVMVGGVCPLAAFVGLPTQHDGGEGPAQ